MDERSRRPGDRRLEHAPDGEVLEGELGDPDAPETAHAARDDRASTSADRLAEHWATEDQRRGPPARSHDTGGDR